MALFPKDFNTQDRVSAGGHGEQFVVNMPGYRTDEARVNRTNNNLSVSQHDVPNIKYDFDDRLPVLFRYGFGYGYNQICVPKGRLAAVDKTMDLIDWESKKQFNTATLANGGVPVRLRKAEDKYQDTAKSKIVSKEAGGKVVRNPGKEWVPVTGLDKTYGESYYRPFVDNSAVQEGQAAKFVSANEQLKTAGYELDVAKDAGDKSFHSGRVKKDGAVDNTVRMGNIPIGMFQRNEYTRDQDAFNGMAVGPILTDAMIEMPWFAFKDKAEANFWGSAYGAFMPGDLVKPDENGRFVKSPLSDEKALATMSVAEYEAERQQVVGQIYAVNTNMVPEGAAIWATWALDDRLNLESFNPYTYRATNRRGEDSIERSPFNSTNEYPGYPYEKAFSDHDLMMMQKDKGYDARMNAEYQYSELGIPGLTDGYNAVVRKFPAEKAGTINLRDEKEKYTDTFVRLLNVNVEPTTLKMAIVPKGTVPEESDYNDVVEGKKYKIKNGAEEVLKVTYSNCMQGIVVLAVADDKKFDEELKKLGAAEKQAVDVYVQYSKRGEAGVPTFVDWDGCVGSLKILLTK